MSYKSVHFDHLTKDKAWSIGRVDLSKRKVRAASKGSIENVYREDKVPKLKRLNKFFHEKRNLKSNICKNCRAKRASIGLKSRTPPIGGIILRKKFK